MGVKLDWEVESECGWSEIGEDPKAVEARRRRARRIRSALLVVLVLLLALAAVVGYRLYTVGQQVHEALEATVAAETLALRIGDREAYLMAQSDLGGWRQLQEQTFQHYQEEATHIDADGQVVQMDISADQARVTLRETVDGEPYHVMWFYKREAGGWRHVAPDPRFWGDQKKQRSTYFRFEYYSEDQPLVDALTEQLDDWWASACNLTQCPYKPAPIDVKIEPDQLVEVGWAQYDTDTLIIPSPLLGRFPADGKPDPQLTAQLADLIAYRWAEHLVGKEEVQLYSELDWLRSEVHRWLRHSFDPTQPPAPLLDPLVQGYDQEIILPLIWQIKNNYPAVLALQGLTEVNAADLPVGWELYLTYKLRAEISLLQSGNDTEAMLLYHDPERVVVDNEFSPLMMESDVNTIQVIGLSRYGDLVWAETVFGGISAPGFLHDATIRVFRPFRLLKDDRWVHTAADLDDWGPAREERGERVILRYYDLDTFVVEGLHAFLEQVYEQVSADMGGPDETPVLVEIIAEGVSSQGTTLEDEQRNSTEVIYLPVASPRFWPYVSAGTIQESVRISVMHDMIALLVEPTLPFKHPLKQALYRWELGRQQGIWFSELGSLSIANDALICDQEISLADLWSLDTDHAECNAAAAKVLLDVLIERYGEEVVARLAPNISQAVSMDDWLYISLGIHAVDIEPEWRERVEARLSASP